MTDTPMGTPMELGDLPATLTFEQVAELLQVSVKTVERMNERGELPAIRVGSKWRVPKHRMIAYLNTGKVTGTDAGVEAEQAAFRARVLAEGS